MTTDNIGALAAALAKAQAGFTPVKRDKKVTVKKKDGGSYSFMYAPLESVLAAVTQPLADNGLVVVQVLDEGFLLTSLIHESGAMVVGRVAIPSGGDIKELGSAITYLRRYALQALLGIAAEDDDDGSRAVGDVSTPAGAETTELLGNLQKVGTFVKGTSDQYKGDWREDPTGHSIGVRLKLAGEDRDIPQVLITGPIGEALYVATEGQGANVLGGPVTVKGKLYGVRSPGRSTYYRLVIGEHPDHDFIETSEWRIPAAPAEAASAPLFDDADQAAIDAALATA
jgi:hypothetical protein